MSSEIITKNDLKAILDGTLPSCAVDYIISESTTGIWSYRKWNSGKYEVWGSSSDSYAMTTAIGSTYYANKTYDLTSLAFVSTPYCLITGGGSGAYFGSKIESISSTSINISARASSSLTATLTHWFYFVGAWK